MEQQLFTNLPSESDVVVDILSRLPVRTIINCKCVCKSWLHLLETSEFVKFHLSKSVPGLVLNQSGCESEFYNFVEFEDELGFEHHDLHYSLVTKFDFPHFVWIQNSANGLLFLRDFHLKPNALYICNPITRDYIKLHCPQQFAYSYPQRVIYGFGSSRMTGQYKMVRIFHDYICNQESQINPEIECHVYTLGTGSWRRIAPCVVPLEYKEHNKGAFVNGNLHWLVRDNVRGCLQISCFDLETETFNTFSPPPIHDGGRSTSLFALENCLCLCDNTSDDEIVTWLMKEYGVEKSWTKEFVISKNPAFTLESYEAGYPEFAFERFVVQPIKVFKDGDILMEWEDLFLFYYSSKTSTTQKVDKFSLHFPDNSVDAVLHTPSFLSLKSFKLENVSSF